MGRHKEKLPTPFSWLTSFTPPNPLKINMSPPKKGPFQKGNESSEPTNHHDFSGPIKNSPQPPMDLIPDIFRRFFFGKGQGSEVNISGPKALRS